MKIKGMWIGVSEDLGDVCPVFQRKFVTKKKIREAVLQITALGVYEAKINSRRVGKFVLAPGWTSYETRLQVQTYEVTEYLQKDNTLEITLGKGWYRSPMPGWVDSEGKAERAKKHGAILAELLITYADGTQDVIVTDDTWMYAKSPIQFSEIYDGEIYDARIEPVFNKRAVALNIGKDMLISQEGEEIREAERVAARKVWVSPAGEILVDFGQEVTGYVEISLSANAGDRVRILHGEVLDKDGNFYNDNYRSAKAELTYVCKNGAQTWHPILTFFGFRYLKLAEYPIEAKAEQFTAVVVHSDIKRTGYVSCGQEKLNKLFSNIIWGQKDNFLDVPTDCPQRDERLGWTGDAQVFVKSASYNYDVEKFFQKWLHDLAADQREDGSVGQVIPDCMPEELPSAAWGDAAVVCPWQIYMTYGDPQILNDQFESMKKWLDFITDTTTTKYLWTGAKHCFGDWLGLDAPFGSFKGSSREEFIQSAYYYYSCSLLVKAGEILGKDMEKYKELQMKIKATFQEAYPDYQTQTEHVLAIHFGLAKDKQQAADDLEALLQKEGVQIKTGFVGTPYLLHALSDNGYEKTAYDLLLREEYPSWLFSVNHGATTIWEHWDGIMADGSFWSKDMNSFNHYAYGSVIDWIYEKAAGIQPLEGGFLYIRIEPKPDRRLGWLEAKIDTRQGLVSSKWSYENEAVRYEIQTPVRSEIIIEGQRHLVEPGRYIYWGKVL